jgi:hypothetical protein
VHTNASPGLIHRATVLAQAGLVFPLLSLARRRLVEKKEEKYYHRHGSFYKEATGNILDISSIGRILSIWTLQASRYFSESQVQHQLTLFVMARAVSGPFSGEVAKSVH